MSLICVVATSPAHDTSIVCGPYKSFESALKASDELTAKGFNTEVCPMTNVRDVDVSEPWDGESES